MRWIGRLPVRGKVALGAAALGVGAAATDVAGAPRLGPVPMDGVAAGAGLVALGSLNPRLTAGILGAGTVSIAALATGTAGIVPPALAGAAAGAALAVALPGSTRSLTRLAAHVVTGGGAGAGGIALYDHTVSHQHRQEVIGGAKQLVNGLTDMVTFPVPTNQSGKWLDFRGALLEPSNAAQLTGASSVLKAQQAVDDTITHPPNPNAANVRDARPILATLQHTSPAGGDVATITFNAAGAGLDWGKSGHTSAVVSVYVDGVRASDVAVLGEHDNYSVNLGRLTAGPHTIELRSATDLDPAGSRQKLTISDPAVHQLHGDAALIAEHAPVFDDRDLGLPGGAAESTYDDTPLLVQPQVTRDAATGDQTIKYGLLLSNEDAGTSPQELMDTKGRTTDWQGDIYDVTLNPTGHVLSQHFEGALHYHHPFVGRTVDGRAELSISTTDNISSEVTAGTPQMRFSPALEQPINGSANALPVMAQHPWTFQVMTKEDRREGVIGSLETLLHQQISDPQNYLYLHGERNGDDTQVPVTLHLTDGTTRTVRSSTAQAGNDGSVKLPRGVTAKDVASVTMAQGTAWVLNDDLTPRRVSTR